MTEGREGTKFGYATKGDVTIYSALASAFEVRDDVGAAISIES
jgi:hypothetical protein